jgi:hypothetical protein
MYKRLIAFSFLLGCSDLCLSNNYPAMATDNVHILNDWDIEKVVSSNHYSSHRCTRWFSKGVLVSSLNDENALKYIVVAKGAAQFIVEVEPNPGTDSFRSSKNVFGVEEQVFYLKPNPGSNSFESSKNEIENELKLNNVRYKVCFIPPSHSRYVGEYEDFVTPAKFLSAFYKKDFISDYLIDNFVEHVGIDDFRRIKLDPSSLIGSSNAKTKINSPQNNQTMTSEMEEQKSQTVESRTRIVPENLKQDPLQVQGVKEAIFTLMKSIDIPPTIKVDKLNVFLADATNNRLQLDRQTTWNFDPERSSKVDVLKAALRSKETTITRQHESPVSLDQTGLPIYMAYWINETNGNKHNLILKFRVLRSKGLDGALNEVLLTQTVVPEITIAEARELVVTSGQAIRFPNGTIWVWDHGFDRNSVSKIFGEEDESNLQIRRVYDTVWYDDPDTDKVWGDARALYRVKRNGEPQETRFVLKYMHQ